MTENTEITDMAEKPATPSREEREAKQYVKRLRGFYMQAIWAAVLVAFLFVINMMTSPAYFWFLWPALGLGIALAARAISLFGLGDMFGPDWEEREIAKRLNKK